MALYKPSELHQLLAELGLHAKKQLSQNFLIDGNIIRKIVSIAQVAPQDLVLEIGPGPGALSQALLEEQVHLLAVEKDRQFAKALPRLQFNSESLEVFESDILEFPIEEEIKKRLQKDSRAKVIANLPYHLTTPILARLIPLNSYFSSLTLMVQEEVARRMTAQPGTKNYSSLTLFLNFYAKVKYGFFVGRNCFFPVPNVDSAIVTLELRQPPLEESFVNDFFLLTRTAFNQRRKMLRTSLKPIYSPEKVADALVHIGKDALSRPEELSLDEFISLFHLLK